MDHSLPLQTKCKWICKQILWCFHICPGSSKNKLYKIWTWFKFLQFEYMQNLSIWYLLPFFQIVFLKGFQLTQPWWGLDATLNKLSKYIKLIKFGVGMKPQFTCFTNALLIGIIMPLIKIQTKYFKNPKKILCWACISHKLHHHIKFITFWNDIVLQIFVLSIITLIGIILPLNKNALATFTKYRTNVILTLEVW